jgi:hypothetical protein
MTPEPGRWRPVSMNNSAGVALDPTGLLHQPGPLVMNYG